MYIQPKWISFCTGKSLSEALIFASTNTQYDNRLFIVHDMTCCVHKLLLLFCFEIQNNFGTQHVLQMLRASEKDLPVQLHNFFGLIDSNRLCQSVINLLKELEQCKANVKIFFMVD